MRQWTIDAFAEQPFRGNPACVVEPLDAWPKDGWMQALAQENNQAETAFLLGTEEPGRFGLRWFTPTTEVKLCGHATLAAAHALAEEVGEQAGTLVFDTLSGLLRVDRTPQGYRLDFPADRPRPIATPAGLAEALGAEPVESWSGFFVIAIMADEFAVRGVRPDLSRLARIDAGCAWGPGHFVVAAPADALSPYDVVSRFFAPGSGIAEDPTTGAAHCALAPLFAGRLGPGQHRFHQAYPGRGGDLLAEPAGDRVLLTGRAVTVAESRLRV